MYYQSFILWAKIEVFPRNIQQQDVPFTVQVNTGVCECVCVCGMIEEWRGREGVSFLLLLFCLAWLMRYLVII